VLAAGLERDPPAAPPEPLTVSIGVLAPEPKAGGGERGGSPGRTRRPEERRAAQASAPSSGDDEVVLLDDTELSTPTDRTARPAASRRISVPSPFADARSLPGLGELGEPAAGGGGGADEGEGGGTGEGGTGSGGTGDGGVAAYRATLAAWLSSRFHVEGSGLGARALRKLRVRAVLELSEDRIVVGYDLERTGTAAIDEAARRALDSVKGQQAPDPPPGYGAVQRRIRVTFVCRPETCD
jgi:hypothetical protein